MEGNLALWYVLQGSIIFAVVASNIHWQITPNGYLASLIGIGLAMAATGAINQLLLWSRQKRRDAGAE